MKKTKILVPAMAVLALGMAASVTGTVAWFSSNTHVSASNMTISATTSKSLMISLDRSDWKTAVEMDSTAARRETVDPVSPVDTNSTTKTSSIAIQNASHDPYTIVNTLDFYHNNISVNAVPNPAEYGADVNLSTAIGQGKIGSTNTGENQDLFLLDDGTNYDKDDLYLLYTDQAGKVTNINMTISVTIANRNVSIWKALHVGVLVCAGYTEGSVEAGDQFYDYDLSDALLTGQNADPRYTKTDATGNSTVSTIEIAETSFFTMASSAEKHMIAYAWFEGEDPDCTSLNSMSAVTDSVVFNFSLGSDATPVNP